MSGASVAVSVRALLWIAGAAIAVIATCSGIFAGSGISAAAANDLTNDDFHVSSGPTRGDRSGSSVGVAEKCTSLRSTTADRSASKEGDAETAVAGRSGERTL